MARERSSISVREHKVNSISLSLSLSTPTPSLLPKKPKTNCELSKIEDAVKLMVNINGLVELCIGIVRSDVLPTVK